MRRRKLWLFAMMSVAALSFTACGSKQEETKASEEVVDFTDLTGKTDTTQTEQVQTEEEATTEVQTEEENHEGMYRSEITNEWIDESIKDQRPIAVMVDNEKTALPHYGLTEADVVYEIMNSTKNGRITRLMAIVKDWGKITQFGSIRSTRPTNIMLAAVLGILD